MDNAINELKEKSEALHARLVAIESILGAADPQDAFVGFWKRGDQSGYKIDKSDDNLQIRGYNFWTKQFEAPSLATANGDGTYDVTMQGHRFKLEIVGLNLIASLNGNEALKMSKTDPNVEYSWAERRELHKECGES